jgi:uncharacterized membrane protein
MAERRAAKAAEKQREMEQEFRDEQRLRQQMERADVDQSNERQRYQDRKPSPALRTVTPVIESSSFGDGNQTRALTQKERNLRHAKAGRNLQAFQSQ